MDGKEKFLFDWSWLAPSGLSTKDFIAPTSFEFKDARVFRMGRKLGAVSFLQILAPELNDRLLADFLDMESSLVVTLAYAGGGKEPTPTPTATPRPSPNPFTPDGTGTVLDNATDEDGKEFFTIITLNENVFYLIIDRQRGSENVYFLNAVTEKDLLALAETAQDGESIIPTPQPKPELTPQPTPQPEPEQAQPEAKKQQSGTCGLLVVLVILLIGGGAAYYFKHKSRQSVKGGTDLDEYDFDTEEDEDMALEDEDLYLDDDETETKDGEQ